MNTRPRARQALIAAVLAALAIMATSCGSGEPPAWAGFKRTPAPTVGDNQLPAVEADGSEAPFALVADDGDLLLIYFGYTSCPDVCPTTLADLRRASDGLGDAADRLDLAMITIDPEVDTPEVLTGYVRSFMPRATALRTTDDALLRPVATAFGADYGKIEQDGELEVYHTGSLYAVDDQGQLILTWPFGVLVEDLERDLGRLLGGERV